MDASAAWLLYPVSGITSFGIDSQHVYFAAGTTVYRTYKPNVAFYTNVLTTTSDPVTQLAVQPGAPNDATTIVYFAAGQNVLQYKQTGGVSGFTNPGGFGIGLSADDDVAVDRRHQRPVDAGATRTRAARSAIAARPTGSASARSKASPAARARPSAMRRASSTSTTARSSDSATDRYLAQPMGAWSKMTSSTQASSAIGDVFGG